MDSWQNISITTHNVEAVWVTVCQGLPCMSCVCVITCSTACKQLQSWACRLRTDSKGSRCSSWSWCSARWGLSPLLKLSSASCRREACLCASSSAWWALSASMAIRAAWERVSSASAFSVAHDWRTIDRIVIQYFNTFPLQNAQTCRWLYEM